jgi:hypothetical protein
MSFDKFDQRVVYGGGRYNFQIGSIPFWVSIPATYPYLASLTCSGYHPLGAPCESHYSWYTSLYGSFQASLACNIIISLTFQSI